MSTPKEVMEVKKGELTLLCWCKIVTFLSHYEEFMSLVLSVPGLLDYIKKEYPDCTIGIPFFLDREFPVETPSFVTNLVVGNDSLENYELEKGIIHSSQIIKEEIVEDKKLMLGYSFSEFFEKVFEKFPNLKVIDSFFFIRNRRYTSIDRRIDPYFVSSNLTKLCLSMGKSSLTIKKVRFPKVRTLVLRRIHHRNSSFFNLDKTESELLEVDWMKCFPVLENFTLDGFELKVLFGLDSKLLQKSLVYLSLDDIKIREEEDVHSLPNLRSLNLSCSSIYNFKNLFSLPCLEYLRISDSRCIKPLITLPSIVNVFELDKKTFHQGYMKKEFYSIFDHSLLRNDGIIGLRSNFPGDFKLKIRKLEDLPNLVRLEMVVFARSTCRDDRVEIRNLKILKEVKLHLNGYTVLLYNCHRIEKIFLDVIGYFNVLKSSSEMEHLRVFCAFNTLVEPTFISSLKYKKKLSHFLYHLREVVRKEDFQPKRAITNICGLHSLEYSACHCLEKVENCPSLEELVVFTNDSAKLTLLDLPCLKTLDLQMEEKIHLMSTSSSLEFHVRNTPISILKLPAFEIFKERVCQKKSSNLRIDSLSFPFLRTIFFRSPMVKVPNVKENCFSTRVVEISHLTNLKQIKISGNAHNFAPVVHTFRGIDCCKVVVEACCNPSTSSETICVNVKRIELQDEKVFFSPLLSVHSMSLKEYILVMEKNGVIIEIH